MPVWTYSLGHSDGGVSEHVAEDVDVHAVLVEVGGAGVPERVRAEVAAYRLVAFGYADLVGVLLDDAAHLTLADLEDLLLGTKTLGGFAEEPGRLGIDQDVAVLVALPFADEDFELGKVEVCDQSVHDFADSHGSGVEKTEQQVIPGVRARGLEQLANLRPTQDGGESVAFTSLFVG